MVNILNEYYGGMSKDDVMMSKGQFVYSDGFDITRNPGELRPMPTLATSYTIGTTAAIGVPTFISQFSDIMIGTSTGKIYSVLGATLYDSGVGSSIIDIVYFGDNTNECYVFLDNRVMRGTLTADVFTGFTTFLSGTQITRPVFGFGYMFFGTSQNVKRVDRFGNMTDVYSSDAPNNTQNKIVTIQGSYLRVYYDKYSAGTTGGGLDIIDIGSLTVSYSVKLPFQPSVGVSGDTIDYIYTGSDIYACSGISYKSICESFYSPLAGISKFNFQLSGIGMDYSNDRLYVTAGSRYMIYGSKHDGLPDSFCYGAYDWLNQSHDTIYAIFANKATNDVWFGYVDGANVKVGYIDHSDYSNGNTVATATIITPYHNFGDYSITKSLDEIRVGMTSTAEGTLYASFDGGSWIEIDTLDQSELGQKIMYYKANFREIAIKLVFSGIIQGRKLLNIDVRFTPYGI